MTIHFGTSGWRAVMADDFTFAAKFIGELINEDKIVLGGEESAGLSIKGHYPEKDGIPARLLAAEAVAARSASLTDQLEHLFSRIGRLESGRIGVRLTPELMPIPKEKLKQEPTALGGKNIKQVNRIDGVKFIFQDGFLAIGASFGNRTPGAHLCGIRIGGGHGGVA